MPYINQGHREEWNAHLEGGLLDAVRSTADVGDINYIITTILHTWLGDCPNYNDYNQAIGVLECAKLELYRRKVSPYEDEAIARNGDL